MGKAILFLYDYFRAHHRVMTAVLIALTLLLGLLLTRVSYKEDITDFLPLDGNHQEAMRLFQNLSGANRIIAIIDMRDGSAGNADDPAAASDNAGILAGAAGALADSVARMGLRTLSTIDMDQASELSDFVYNNIPYFLTCDDYRRMDSLLSTPGYVRGQLSADKEMLLFPSGGILSGNIGRDPLNLFTPTVEKLGGGAAALNYELYDGHIFTPDMRHAVVIAESPYGSSETEHNTRLISRMRQAADSVMAHCQGVDIRLTGGPVIAVGNASRIKADSIWTVTVAVVLILLLLSVSLRSVRNIALIAVTIAWGWLFALGCLSIVHDTVSLIVIGVSSIIIGIAVNYPLHLVAHLNHTPDVRKALREIVEPLLVGNITTIGAFLALVPLKSVALRDLGLFAAFLLIGTIIFVFAFLPHLVKVPPKAKTGTAPAVGNVRLENKRWLVATVMALSVVLAFFSLRTTFDPDISHINYMSPEEKADMASLSSLLRTTSGTRTLYAVAGGDDMDEAMLANESVSQCVKAMGFGTGASHEARRFLPSRHEQGQRLALWRQFTDKYAATVTAQLAAAAADEGFADGSFNDFTAILTRRYPVQEPEHFNTLINGPLRQCVYHDDKNGRYCIVTPITVKAEKAGTDSDRLDKALAKTGKGNYCFEIGQLNRSIAASLSDNFNYIGFACSFIVFFFLWVSMGNLELAALSFLPMAVSWLWILGLMAVFGIKFNIINIILATFIFGQGDDYTIFMTEGCQYEYAYGRRMLASYKSSIVLSALIMFIGMGVLVFARHPALRSLGEVTLVGMFSVVLMAWLLPSFFFRWIVGSRGRLRKRPLTLKSLLMPRRYPQEAATGMTDRYYIKYVRDVYYYCGVEIVGSVKGALAHYGDYVSHDCPALRQDGAPALRVEGGSYGAVALLMALLHPDTTVVAVAANDDDAAVCRNVACRIVGNIIIENG